jgi:hypothetical protein
MAAAALCRRNSLPLKSAAMNTACLTMILAAADTRRPDGIDLTVTVTYLSLAFGLAAFGYVCMVLDLRAYLRSLRRALMIVTGYRVELPEWVRKDTPRCILALGLTLPCTSADILAAYRRKVKQLHPDRGGNRREFMRLQSHFEEAMSFIQN